MNKEKEKDIKISGFSIVIVVSIATLIMYLLLLMITTIIDAREEKILENGCPKCHCAYELDSYSYSKNSGYVYDYECPSCHTHIYTSVTIEEEK